MFNNVLPRRRNHLKQNDSIAAIVMTCRICCRCRLSLSLCDAYNNCVREMARGVIDDRDADRRTVT